MDKITTREFLILLFQMIFLISGICMIYTSIFKAKVLYPNKYKFLIINSKKYIFSVRIIYFILGLLSILASTLSLISIININITGICWGILILVWTYLDYYLRKKYLIPLENI